MAPETLISTIIQITLMRIEEGNKEEWSRPDRLLITIDDAAFWAREMAEGLGKQLTSESSP